MNYYQTMYSQEKRDYSIGCYYACGSYALIMTYDTKSGYPTSCECLACTFSQKIFLWMTIENVPNVVHTHLYILENLTGEYAFGIDVQIIKMEEYLLLWKCVIVVMTIKLRKLVCAWK
ncbi:hypothetical protein CN622_22985 [Bacillus wiedmannii]|nr:hypothetical protein CN622_22985 [Bacillus wiedmannii]